MKVKKWSKKHDTGGREQDHDDKFQQFLDLRIFFNDKGIWEKIKNLKIKNISEFIKTYLEKKIKFLH